MSILAALTRAYDRLPDVPQFGYASIGADFCVVLNHSGHPAFDPVDFRVDDGKRTVGRRLYLPSPLAQRTSGISANFLWDKTAYSLGVSAKSKRSDDEHQEFVSFHRGALDSTSDEGLRAFLAFLEWWSPQRFAELSWPDAMVDANIVFAIENEYRERLLHERPEAQTVWASVVRAQPASELVCQVTGNRARIARSHPPIKLRRRDAQSSGNFIVSYNEDAFVSYDHDQGDNAQISEVAAFKYTTTLNAFLDQARHRIQIGDASTVFWADASKTETESLAEGLFQFLVDERSESERIKVVLSKVRQGRVWTATLNELDPGLSEGVRFHILGLSPNAARISVRFWFDDDFGVLAKNYAAYISDMNFEPWPRDRGLVGLRRLVLRTAPARRQPNRTIAFDGERVSPILSGELLRAIVSGGRFPAALLPLLLLRIRTDRILDSVRIALVKATLVRTMRLENRLPKDMNDNAQEDYLVRSDPNDPNPARRLGRLFAIIERAQLAALGDEINTTVKDKYLGTAAATPGRIMGKLVLNAEQHHIKRLRNGHSDARWISDAGHARRVGAGLQRDIGQLFASFDNAFPAQHSSEEQALFLVGYYQERFGSSDDHADDDVANKASLTDASEETSE